jgi:hypothetical protein
MFYLWLEIYCHSHKTVISSKYYVHVCCVKIGRITKINLCGLQLLNLNFCEKCTRFSQNQFTLQILWINLLGCCTIYLSSKCLISSSTDPNSFLTTVNLRFNGLVGGYRRVKGHSRKYITGYVSSTDTEGVWEEGDEKIYGPKREEVTGGWRELQNEELHNLYSSPSIVRMIKSKGMRWTGHVARMGKRWIYIGHWWERQKERDR